LSKVKFYVNTAQGGFVGVGLSHKKTTCGEVALGINASWGAIIPITTPHKAYFPEIKHALFLVVF